MTIATESKWDEDIRTFLRANAALMGEVPTDHIFVQGEPYGHEVANQFIIIRSLTYSFETQLGNDFFEQNINMNLLIKNTDWDSRASVEKTRRIALLIGKIFLADVTVAGGYRLIFSRSDVVEAEIPDNVGYPTMVTIMTFSGLRELETAIVLV